MNTCTGCGTPNCSHLWPHQKKCCPDCSHLSSLAEEVRFIGPRDLVRSPSGLPMLIQKNAICNAPGSAGN
jgi:transposase